MDQVPAPNTVCYRHPGRPTRLRCSECGRSICVECSNDAAVGQKCPDCAVPRGRNRVITARNITHADRRTTPLTMTLIAINVGIWLLGTLVPDLGDRMLQNGAQWRFYIEQGEWWRGFTAMFLHAGGFTHILFNTWALWVFGPALERRWGTIPFGTLYLAAGLSGGALFHALGDTSPAVGASGAIFGLFGALLLGTYRQRHTAMGRTVFNQLGILLAINLALPIIIPRIAWEAHVGGLIAGVIITFAWERLPSRGPGIWMQRAIVALSVATAAVLMLVLL